MKNEREGDCLLHSCSCACRSSGDVPVNLSKTMLFSVLQCFISLWILKDQSPDNRLSSIYQAMPLNSFQDV